MRLLAIHVLRPFTHFPFEEWWTEELHYKVVARPGPEFPPVFREGYGRMLGAIEAEKERRRARGDDASVERFEREWAWIIDAEEHDPVFREQFEEERRIVLSGGSFHDAGWWTWIAPPETRCIQAFLRGDDVDIARRATPPRTTDEETGRAIPAWTASGSNRGPGSAISILGPITHYTFEEVWTREAHEAYAQSEEMRTARPPQPAYFLARGGIELGLEAEADRRHACGDHGSVERYERRRQEIYEASKGSIDVYRDRFAPDMDMEEEWRLVKSAPDTWPDVGIWTWINPRQVRLWQAFLRGDPIEGEPVLADIPITHFPFEEPWTDDDREVLDAWKDGDPLPPAAQRLEHAIEGAIVTEKMRRRGIGDEASNAEFDRRWAEIYAGQNDPAYTEQVNAQRAEVYRSCPHWGWWMWMAVPTVLLIQKFLRGEPMADTGGPAPDAGAARDVPGDAGSGPAAQTSTQDTAGPEATRPSGATSGTGAGPEFVAHFPFEETWTDDDHRAMSDAGPESIPFAYRRVLAGMELAVLAEKRRRRAAGDTASIAAFERERTSIGTRHAEDAAYQEECTAQRLTVLETTGRQWGWWIWLPVPEVRLIQTFLRGEPVGGTDATADDGARDDPALPLHEQVSAAAAAKLGLDTLSITHFAFEASWTSAADSVMQAGGSPPAWTATLQGLAQATGEEKERRHSAGDIASVQRFEVGYARWVLESKRNARFRDASWRESSLAAVYSGEDWGFWTYWPLVQVQGIQAFLRGESISDAYVAGPASPTPPVHLFPFEEPWSFDDDVYMTVRTNDSHPGAWEAVMTGFGAAIRAEKERRHAAGDTDSVDRFETLTARIGEEMAEPGAQARRAEELKAAAARGEDWTQSFWQWHYPPLARLAIAFLRGEHLQPPDAQGPTLAPAAEGVHLTVAAPETTTALPTTTSPHAAPRTSVATEAAVPSAEYWEPRWGAEQIEAAWSWQREGAPPRAFLRILGSMNAAVARERDRRREAGDAASVERFEREMQVADETTRAQEESWRDELFARLSRHEDVGFWDCLPPRMAALTRRFLRGEHAG